MRYTLSRRQWAMIRDEGRAIRIALPMPWGGVADPRDYAYSMLDVPAGSILAAKIDRVCVDRGASTIGLAAVHGRILEPPRATGWPVPVVMVIVGPAGQTRAKRVPEWPGGVVSGGRIS